MSNLDTKIIYDKNSSRAEEFINDREILDTIEFGRKNKNNRELLLQILDKARLGKGLEHREAFLLLSCEEDDINKEILNMARELKKKLYGNRIVLFK